MGSISHTADTCMAVVGLREQLNVAGLGLDVEVTDRLTPDLYGQILVESERRAIDSQSEADRRVAASEIFGAKEAFYKAQFPLTRSWVDFTDVRVTRQGDVPPPRSGRPLSRPSSDSTGRSGPGCCTGTT